MGIGANNATISAALTAKAAEYTDLDDKGRAFSIAYALEANGKKAAIAAGYTKGGAGNGAKKQLRDGRVLSLIAELRALLPDLAALEPAAVQARLAMLSMTDVAGMLVPDERYPDADPVIYRWKRPEELTTAERALVQDVQLVEHWSKGDPDNGVAPELRQDFKYKILNKKDSLDSLARTFGLFRDRVEHEHSHRVKHLFAFIAKHPAESETVAWLNKRHGRTIEGEAVRISHNDPENDHAK